MPPCSVLNFFCVGFPKARLSVSGVYVAQSSGMVHLFGWDTDAATTKGHTTEHTAKFQKPYAFVWVHKLHINPSCLCPETTCAGSVPRAMLLTEFMHVFVWSST
jgi:hypothetical protein